MSEQGSGDVFSSLLSDPAMLSSIAQLLSSANQSRSAVPEAENISPSNSSAVGAAPDLSGIISSALSNPQIMAALPKMIQTLSASIPETAPSSQAPEQSTADGSVQASAQNMGTGMGGLGALLPALSGAAGGYKKPPRVTDRRSALLMALKPYMSHDKAEMIDTIVRVIEIMSAVNGVQ